MFSLCWQPTQTWEVTCVSQHCWYFDSPLVCALKIQAVRSSRITASEHACNVDSFLLCHIHTHSVAASLSCAHRPSMVFSPLSEPVLASLSKPAGQEPHCPEASPYVPIFISVKLYGQYRHTGSDQTVLWGLSQDKSSPEASRGCTAVNCKWLNNWSLKLVPAIVKVGYLMITQVYVLLDDQGLSTFSHKLS